MPSDYAYLDDSAFKHPMMTLKFQRLSGRFIEKEIKRIHHKGGTVYSLEPTTPFSVIILCIVFG